MSLRVRSSRTHNWFALSMDGSAGDAIWGEPRSASRLSLWGEPVSTGGEVVVVVVSVVDIWAAYSTSSMRIFSSITPTYYCGCNPPSPWKGVVEKVRSVGFAKVDFAKGVATYMGNFWSVCLREAFFSPGLLFWAWGSARKLEVFSLRVGDSAWAE